LETSEETQKKRRRRRKMGKRVCATGRMKMMPVKRKRERP
jgi:hypothetical protein